MTAATLDRPRPSAPPSAADVLDLAARQQAARSAESRLAAALAALAALDPPDLRLVAAEMAPAPADPLDAALAALRRLAPAQLAELVLDLSPPCRCGDADADPFAEMWRDPALRLADAWRDAPRDVRRAFAAAVTGGRR